MKASDDTSVIRPVSQRRNFLLLVSMFLHVQVILILLAAGSLMLTNEIRAYTTGEGLYAKAQKRAVIALVRYADSEDPADYAEYRDEIAVPIGDRYAREILDSSSPDTRQAEQAFLQGRNHPDDVAGMARAFLLFRDMELFRGVIGVWERADGIVSRIDERAQELHAAIRDGELSPARRDELLRELVALDQDITELQDRFSAELGAISRLIRNFAIALLAATSMLLWTACLVFGLRLHRRSVESERQLIERERRLRTLMDSTADGIVSLTADGRIERANRATEHMLSYAGNVLEGRPVETLIDETSRDDFSVALHSASAASELPGAGREIVLQGLRSDGTTFPAEVVFTREEGGGEGRLIMVLRDVSQRLATEAKLFQAQKMEAVGQLTGGVAHDFNNLLTVITGNLELLREDLDDPQAREQAERQIDAALNAAERGARVTSHLLAFSRQQPLAPRLVDVDRLVDHMRELFEQTVSGAITLEYDLNSCGWRAMIDAVQLESALLNLVLNARHATPDGGKIRISSAQVTPDDDVLAELDLPAGEYVRIAVSDSGAGIDPAIIDRVFEPFFTTREVGAGTGLGLSMVHGFVQQSEGQVRIESEPGKGTTAELFLLRAHAAAPDEVSTTTRRAVATAGASVLVVEDHPALCLLAVRMLESQGYVAEGVADAGVALERLADGPLPDLLLSDVVLPEGMNGVELVAQVRERYPAIAVLLMSGYPRDALPASEDNHVALLHKPFTRGELLQAVADALAQFREQG